LPRLVDVDLVTEFGRFRQHSYRVGRHGQETAVHRRADVLAVRAGDRHYAAFDQLTEHRLVAGHDADLALRGLGDDERPLARPQPPLDGDQLDGHLRHCNSSSLTGRVGRVYLVRPSVTSSLTSWSARGTSSPGPPGHRCPGTPAPGS